MEFLKGFESKQREYQEIMQSLDEDHGLLGYLNERYGRENYSTIGGDYVQITFSEDDIKCFTKKEMKEEARLYYTDIYTGQRCCNCQFCKYDSVSDGFDTIADGYWCQINEKEVESEDSCESFDSLVQTYDEKLKKIKTVFSRDMQLIKKARSSESINSLVVKAMEYNEAQSSDQVLVIDTLMLFIKEYCKKFDE